MGSLELYHEDVVLFYFEGLFYYLNIIWLSYQENMKLLAFTFFGFRIVVLTVI